MKKSDEKKKFVEELIKLSNSLDVVKLYHLPRQDVTQNWIAETAAVLKNLDEGDYQAFVILSGVITPTEKNRETRKKAAYKINAFIKRKVAEYERYDFSYLDGEKWNTDHMPAGYPKECDTDLLKNVIQDLNDEYRNKKSAGKNNKIWEDIILQSIKSGTEELQRREIAKNYSTQSAAPGSIQVIANRVNLSGNFSATSNKTTNVNDNINTPKDKKKWYENILINWIVFLVIALLAAYLTYLFGWNKF